MCQVSEMQGLLPQVQVQDVFPSTVRLQGGGLHVSRDHPFLFIYEYLYPRVHADY